VIGDPNPDPDLVALYDLDNPGGADHAHHRALADEIDARSIVDLGCGTGLLTRSLAGLGRAVIGVDPSRTMLDYARRQPGAESVTWIRGGAAALAPTGADVAQPARRLAPRRPVGVSENRVRSRRATSPTIPTLKSDPVATNPSAHIGSVFNRRRDSTSRT
jgi:SAM-dependent methyltransferase